MSWFDDVAKFILEDRLEDYANTFLSPTSLNKSGKSIFINSCPFCGHKDCFSVTKGKNAANCFSCSTSGTLIQIVQKLHGDQEGIEMLADWSGFEYDFSSYNPEKQEAKERNKRIQKILNHAVDFFHMRLRHKNEFVVKDDQMIRPLENQINKRKHKPETLVKYKVGYSSNRNELIQELVQAGYDQDEINEASKVFSFPKGYFLYPYFDEKGNVLRINARLFIRYCRGTERVGGGYTYDCDTFYTDLSEIQKQSHEDIRKGHVMNPNRLSRGVKEQVFLFHPEDIKGKKKKYAILVEGENDLFSTDEALQELPPEYAKKYTVIGLGGNPPKGMFKSELLRQFDEIYEAFDNDDGGDKYRKMLNEEMPEVPLKRINIPREYNDIDLFLKTAPNAIELFQDMLDRAEMVLSDGFIVTRDGKKHNWTIKNRELTLDFNIESSNGYKKSIFQGTLAIYVNGVLDDRLVGELDNLKVGKGSRNRLKLKLSDALNKYYNHLPWIRNEKQSEPNRSFEELLDLFRFTKQREDAIKQIAWYLFHSRAEDYKFKVQEIQKQIRNHDDVDLILKEVNGYQNKAIDPYARFPRMQLAQSFYPENGDGYMYFAKFLQDGEEPKRVPCFISSKKEEIRLDLMKKKSAQSLLLINNKYELPVEVEANIADVDDISLQERWIHKWKKDELSEMQYHPSTIIREIESFIRQVYYTTPETVKVLSLWIYATYFYTLFKNGFPYLVFNGAKGTGKSTLDAIVHLLAFNPTFAVSISSAALFRQISIFGGTFILDEQEDLSDSNKNNQNEMVSIIKGGYSDKGKVYRFNNDTQMADGFTAFGPKVISNINGVDDVISDRCITIRTFYVPQDKLNTLIDVEEFYGGRREEVHSITSRAAISALSHFQTIYDMFQSADRVATGNARLTQILRPLVAIARVVGGDYEDHLMRFYSTDIKNSKAETALNTLEGKVKHVLLSIAEEVLGVSRTPWVLGKSHLYDKEISADPKSLVFSLDSMHFKVLCEELANDPNDNYLFKEINDAIKNVVGKDFDIKKNRKPTRITINDENLLRAMQGKKYPHGYRYTFNARQFITQQMQKLEYSEEPEAAESLF